MSRLGMMVQEWLDREDRTAAALARRLDVSRSTARNWVNQPLSRLPPAETLRALAVQIGQPYRVVLDAVLRDAGYLVSEELLEHQPVDAGEVVKLQVPTRADPARSRQPRRG